MLDYFDYAPIICSCAACSVPDKRQVLGSQTKSKSPDVLQLLAWLLERDVSFLGRLCRTQPHLLQMGQLRLKHKHNFSNNIRRFARSPSVFHHHILLSCKKLTEDQRKGRELFRKVRERYNWFEL